MQIQENISLKPYNTFGINAKARYFASFKDTDELIELVTQNSKLTTLILGAGSNVLFTKDVDGLVLKNEIKGIQVVHEDPEFIYAKTGAGENWHSFVLHCIERNWAGIENLSLIPGNIGASPMQNIGAYGVELRDVFWSLEALHLQQKKVFTFTLSDCEFGYRESIFKTKYKDQFVVLNVTFCLRRHPVYHTSYGAIKQELEKRGVKELSIRAISQAVINIRSSKLPDPKNTGNAGSFFRNPLIPDPRFQKLKEEYPGMVGHLQQDGEIKLSAGWLIEQCGPKDAVSPQGSATWKGFRRGDAGCYEKQALVLVNYGYASGKEIFDLSEEIRLSVKEKFAVDLVREVNIV